jgi:ankyrin repeat protein
MGMHSTQVVVFLIAAATAKEEDDDWSELHVAAINGNLGEIRDLLSQGEELQAHPGNQITPLHLACASGSREVVVGLLEQGAAHLTGSLDLVKKTPLHYAAAVGAVGCVLALLDKGVHIDAADYQNKTPLHMAVGLGHTEVVSLLINRSCSLWSKDANGFTALHYAAMHGRIECVKILLEQPTVLIDALADNGITPLFLAAHAGHVAIVNLLVLKGANLNLATAVCTLTVNPSARAHCYWYNSNRVSVCTDAECCCVWPLVWLCSPQFVCSTPNRMAFHRCMKLREVETPSVSVSC